MDNSYPREVFQALSTLSLVEDVHHAVTTKRSTCSSPWSSWSEKAGGTMAVLVRPFATAETIVPLASVAVEAAGHENKGGHNER